MRLRIYCERCWECGRWYLEGMSVEKVEEMCGAEIDKQRVTPRRVTRYVCMEYIRLHNDMAWTHTKSLPFFD